MENKSTNNYNNYNDIPIGMPMSVPPTPITNDEVAVIPDTETLYQITINKFKEIPAKYILFFIGLVFICITILIRPQEVSDLSKAIIPSVTHIQKQNLDNDTTTQSDSSLPKLPTLKDEQ